MKKQFELDFSECSSIGEIYEVIKKEMRLPEWFGNNLSAFWDCLTGMIEVPATIIIHRKVKNEELLSYIDKLISIAKRAEKEEILRVFVIER